MAKGISIHVGVRQFEAAAYGVMPSTVSCATDAGELKRVAKDRGFAAQEFSDHVTLGAVQTAVLAASTALTAGDYFLLTFSSHGFPAFGGLPQAWCFSDEKLDRHDSKHGTVSVDSWLRSFASQVRTLVVANCCFASSSESPAEAKAGPLVLPQEAVAWIAARDPRFEMLQARTFMARVFDGVKNLVKMKPTFTSHVVELAACRANQQAFDGSDKNAMTPFAEQVHKLATADTHVAFADYMTTLELNCSSASIPKPILTPFPVKDAAFNAVGPYRVR